MRLTDISSCSVTSRTASEELHSGCTSAQRAAQGAAPTCTCFPATGHRHFPLYQIFLSKLQTSLFSFSERKWKREANGVGKIDYYRNFPQTEIENEWQNLCLLCYYICSFIDLFSRTDCSWTVKGPHKTPLPLHKTTEVSCHFSTFLTEFMLPKRLWRKMC